MTTSRHILVVGDNLNLPKHIKEGTIPTRKFAACVTSPPYKHDPGNGHMDGMGFSAFHLNQLAVTLKERLHGPLWLNFGDLAGQMDRSPGTAGVFADNGFSWIQTIIWAKHYEGKGQFTPVRGEKRFNPTHEYIYLMVPTNWTNKYRLDRLAIGVPYTDKSNITRFTKERKKSQSRTDLKEPSDNRFNHGADVRCPGTVWFMPYETATKKEQKGHPCRFPLALPTKCIQATRLGNDPWVLDPFAGSGTTMLAAKELGVSSVGYEIDERMIDVIQRRIPDVEIVH